MAESADVLRAPHQQVILPDLAAGCSMADMAAADQLEIVLGRAAQMGARRTRRRARHLHQLDGGHQGVRRRARRHRLHVVQRGGDADVGAGSAARSCCSCPTSTSGRNTAYKMGVPLDQMVVWDPHEPFGGLDARRSSQRAKLILWKGHCSVHTRFTVAADRAGPRASIPASGSSCIPSAVRRRAGGRRQRLDRVHPQARCTDEPAGLDLGGRHRGPPGQPSGATRSRRTKTVVSLDQFGCLCSTMFRVSPNHLLWMLEGAGRRRGPQPRSSCRTSRRSGLKIALDRMLSI